MFSLDTPHGRIRLVELHQGATYYGQSEGYPNVRVNAGLVARLPRRAAALFGRDVPVHALAPRLTEKPWPFPPPDPGDHPPLPWVELPAVWCAGLWETPMDADLDWWALGVVWFQGAAGLPADADVLAALHALDLGQLGVRCSF